MRWKKKLGQTRCSSQCLNAFYFTQLHDTLCLNQIHQRLPIHRSENFHPALIYHLALHNDFCPQIKNPDCVEPTTHRMDQANSKWTKKERKYKRSTAMRYNVRREDYTFTYYTFSHSKWNIFWPKGGPVSLHKIPVIYSFKKMSFPSFSQVINFRNIVGNCMILGFSFKI